MSSRFKGIFDVAKETVSTPPQLEKKTPEKKIKKEIKEPDSKQEIKVEREIKEEPQLTRKKGTGKSSNPDYTQALAYVRKDTLQNVRERLFYDSTKDFSDLVESLLSDWVKKGK